ncbi:response regulator [Marivirga tractuosa]|uniref:Response regulator receiver protein n=1 Tax=Marivirga tractuosa (strain ATCC 23168 / DSM 4126 / NBRC 15989 / NCIMB 1408 / VKM B-1430 / H-43) TaxID=643867 RepID=E4TLJ2_MARTH|nr:response regulator [Marivirga tractuosa]ADR22296.1 response regulator receiver protein [Marivirga tractuosa DSM 4126]BDD13237.1 response regulator [Marivirga tractuosa]
MRKLNILLVEDSKEDAFLIREALEGLTFLDKLYHVENGAIAINFLKKEEPYSEAETPDLILMDINMPVMDGHEALKIIKSIEEVKHVPVLMLTTSSRKEDILRAYQEQSSSYIVKPDDIYELDNLAEAIRDYWNNTVRLPRK